MYLTPWEDGHQGTELGAGSVRQPGTVDPADQARAELRDETGLRAGLLTWLGVLDVAPGRAVSDEVGEPEREPTTEQDMCAR